MLLTAVNSSPALGYLGLRPETAIVACGLPSFLFVFCQLLEH